MKDKEKLIHLGTCGRPHGINGGFSAALFNKQDSSLAKGVKILAKPKGSASSVDKDGQTLTIKSVSLGNKAIIFFEEVPDRNAVESMVPFDIYIKRGDLPDTSEDEFYIEDLVGMKVVNPDGVEIGKVKNYFDNGAQLVLVVQKQKGTIELPFVEAFFPDIDIKRGVVTMLEPEII